MSQSNPICDSQGGKRYQLRAGFAYPQVDRELLNLTLVGDTLISSYDCGLKGEKEPARLRQQNGYAFNAIGHLLAHIEGLDNDAFKGGRSQFFRKQWAPFNKKAGEQFRNAMKTDESPR